MYLSFDQPLKFSHCTCFLVYAFLYFHSHSLLANLWVASLEGILIPTRTTGAQGCHPLGLASYCELISLAFSRCPLSSVFLSPPILP